MVICENIKKEYTEGKYFCALKDISLNIEKNEFVAIVGKSGSGKSTLLNIIGLIDSPSSGNIKVNDIATNELHSIEKAKLRSQKIGYIFQSFYLEPSYTVYKNIEIPLLISNCSAKDRRIRIEQCLKKVDMLHKINDITTNLSGGEKQRVCIARALANSPELILADEPCGNLDSENSENIMNLLLALKKEGKTIILVTHNKDEAKLADRIITLKDGMMIKNEI